MAVTTPLLTPWWWRNRREAETSEANGGIEPTAILDWRSPEVRALTAELGSADHGRDLLQRAHSVIAAKVRPVYAVDDARSVSRTLAVGRGSCSQRLAVLEAARVLPGSRRGLAGCSWMGASGIRGFGAFGLPCRMRCSWHGRSSALTRSGSLPPSCSSRTASGRAQLRSPTPTGRPYSMHWLVASSTGTGLPAQRKCVPPATCRPRCCVTWAGSTRVMSCSSATARHCAGRQELWPSPS
jgi:hypothetical protein